MNIGWIFLGCMLVVLILLALQSWRRRGQATPMANVPYTRSMNDVGSMNAENQMAEIALLLSQGKKIQAIKLYREHTGTGLADAKAAIERMEVAIQLDGGVPGNAAAQMGMAALAGTANMDAAQNVPLTEITVLLSQGKKIQAIKLYRERTGTGLADAKQAVDRIEQSMNMGL